MKADRRFIQKHIDFINKVYNKVKNARYYEDGTVVVLGSGLRKEPIEIVLGNAQLGKNLARAVAEDYGLPTPAMEIYIDIGDFNE